MDKEKEIERLTDTLVDNGVFNNLVCRQEYAYPDAVINECCRQTSEIVLNAGYGNVKQAVKDFAEICKKKAGLYGITAKEIDELFKERFGGEDGV